MSQAIQNFPRCILLPCNWLRKGPKLQNVAILYFFKITLHVGKSQCVLESSRTDTDISTWKENSHNCTQKTLQIQQRPKALTQRWAKSQGIGPSAEPKAKRQFLGSTCNLSCLPMNMHTAVSMFKQWSAWSAGCQSNPTNHAPTRPQTPVSIPPSIPHPWLSWLQSLHY